MARSAAFVPDDCLLFEECGRGAFAKGYCLMHYKRIWRHGSNVVMKLPNGTLPFDNLRSHGWVVTESDCWEYSGGKDAAGYGAVYAMSETLRAHRVSYEHFNGSIPEGLMICHSCDNPPCVNPKHLWPGTNRDNMIDMASKGRGGKARGTQNGTAKITPEDAIEIYNLKGKEEGYKIAERYGITGAAVSSIQNGKNWSWITSPSSS